jgi:adenosylcobyric acid synthase
MVLGTASHVGKSLIAAALCRILNDDGYRVAPFKAQNMSLNSAATPEGGEIGRAQAMQAEAARIAPTVDMNPVLLKPVSDSGSQVVVLGRSRGVESARDYHQNRVGALFPIVVEAYHRLAERFDIVVLEGAGSPAEINLKPNDIVNMRMAKAANAACLLVGDIDRGGVFAALLGTLELLEPDERTRIAGFAINKFRGDLALLAPGVTDIERRIGIESLGVVPWLPNVGLDEEDSVALDDAPRVAARRWAAAPDDPTRRLRVAVIALPYLANATDFAALAAEPSVDVAYAHSAADLDAPDVLILPGTKDTLGALRWLTLEWRNAIRAFARCKPLFGICGGYQMLGLDVADPYDVEGGGAEPGLALLPVRTVLAREKVTRGVAVRLRAGTPLFGSPLAAAAALTGRGYEIHLGRTHIIDAAEAFADLVRDGGERLVDGAVSSNGRVIGTYVHGLFVDDSMRWAFVRGARMSCGLAPPAMLVPYRAERNARFDRLAAHVRAALNMQPLLRARSLLPDTAAR